MTALHSPFARGGSPRLALRILAVSLLAGAALALGASVAGAQTTPPPPEPPVTLVSNLGTSHFTLDFINDAGQAFTTGRDPRGYVVSSATIQLEYGTDPFVSGDFELSVWSTDANGVPAEKLGVLTAPDSLLSNSANSGTVDYVFTAPASGIYLKSGTTYFLVLDVLPDATPAGKALFTGSDAEDQSGQMYWAIADGHVYRSGTINGDAAGWTADPTYSLKFNVAGRDARVSEQTGVPAEDLAQVGQSVWRQSPCGGSRPPSLSPKEMFSGVMNFCNTRTGQWVKGTVDIPGRDYSADKDLQIGGTGNRCDSQEFYDPIADKCQRRSPKDAECLRGLINDQSAQKHENYRNCLN